MASIQEMVQNRISQYTALAKEYEQLQARQREIEAVLNNGDGHASKAPKVAKAPKVKAPKAKVAKTPKAKVAKVGRPKSNGEAKVNKAEAIRLYAAENKEARPKDIIKALGEKGITVGPAAVWQALNHMPTGAKRGRPAEKAPTKKSAKATSGRGRREAGHTLADVVLKILGRNKNGLTLTDITQRVKSSGYETSAKDSSLSPAVQNCLAKLREKEVVSKDDETRRYSVKVA